MADLTIGVAAWLQEDADWERWQSVGSAAHAAGDDKTASDAFSHALRIARQCFEPGDPRLASSIASHALMLSQRKDPLANKLIAEAIDQWNGIEDWLNGQPLPKLARSSMFHVRLETKHPGAYPNDTYRQCLSLAATGMAATKTLTAGERATCKESDRAWRPASQENFDTLRKVTAAVRLMAWR